jgi:diacylglycerol kinase (ATP)
MHDSCHIIWNKHAGTAEQYTRLRDQLAAKDNVVLHEPASADNIEHIVAQAVSGGAAVVVAAGGDGTVNAVVRALAKTGFGATLGVIPLGTGNDFCRNYGIPLDPYRAARLLQEAAPQTIDVIEARGPSGVTHYINMGVGGNMGLYADMVTEDMKHFWGPLVYLRGVVDLLTHLKVYHIQVSFDEEPEQEFKALNIFIANGRATGGGLLVAPDAKMDDGLMDVVVVKDCSPVEIASLAAQYTLSDYRKNENIVFRRVQSLTLSSEPPLPFSTDGESLRQQPTEFRVVQDRLRILAADTR